MEKLKKSAQNLLSELATQPELEFLSDITGGHERFMLIQKDKIISDFYLSKLSEKVNLELIASNEKLASSRNKQATALIFFTGGIMFVGIVQIVITIIISY